MCCMRLALSTRSPPPFFTGLGAQLGRTVLQTKPLLLLRVLLLLLLLLLLEVEAKG